MSAFGPSGPRCDLEAVLAVTFNLHCNKRLDVYWTTSSAATCRVCGTARPSALAHLVGSGKQAVNLYRMNVQGTSALPLTAEVGGSARNRRLGSTSAF